MASRQEQHPHGFERGVDMQLNINSVCSAIPNTVLDVAEGYERLGISSGEARVFSRLYELPRCPVSEEPESELVLSAVRGLIETSGCDPDRIACLIHAHTGAVIGPFSRSLPLYLARRLRLDRAMAFGTCSNNCIAVYSALETSARILRSAPAGSKAVVVVGEVADNLELRVVRNVAIVGDAAAAVLLGADGGPNKMLSLVVHTHPGYAAGIWMPADCEASREFEALFSRRLHAVIEAALGKAGVALADVAWIIPHNVNVWMWRKAAQFMGFPIERIYLENTQRTAHCLGADLFLNLDALSGSGRLQPGDVYLMASAGIGGVMGAVVFRH